MSQKWFTIWYMLCIRFSDDLAQSLDNWVEKQQAKQKAHREKA